MIIFSEFVMGAVFLGAIFSSSSVDISDSKELVANPNFIIFGSDDLPISWSVWQPMWNDASCNIKVTPEGLLMEGVMQWAGYLRISRT